MLTTNQPPPTGRRVKLMVSINDGGFTELFQAMNKVELTFSPVLNEGHPNMRITTKDGATVDFKCIYADENPNSGLENY